jgi:uncharacterized protein (TIRG00374 family)
MIQKYDLLGLLRKRALTVVIAISVFYIFLAVFSDVNLLVQYFHKVDVNFLFLILLSFAASIFFKSLRQGHILKNIQITPSFKDNLVLYLSGLSMSITPLSVGQMIKSHYLLKYYHQPISKTLPIVIIERYHDVLALLSFSIIFVLANDISILKIPIFTIAIIFAVFTLAARSSRLIRLFEVLINKTRLSKKFQNKPSDFRKTLFSIFQRKAFLSCWCLSMVSWLFEAIGVSLCFSSLNLNFSFDFTTAFYFSSIIFGAISLLPAGIGVTEVSFVHLLSYYGVGLSTSTALILLIRLSSLWFSTLIGIIATRLVVRK